MQRIHRMFLFGGVLSLVAALSATRSIGCGLDWTEPQNHFDGVDERGNLSYWEKIGDLDLGKDLKIPLVMGFNSARNTSSPYLGDGWLLALLDSNIVQIDEKRFMMVQPDGWITRFGRKQASDTTLSGQKGWAAEINGSQITVWAECGWKLIFTNGKITSITTPQNQELTYVYAGDGVKEIDEGATPVLKVNRDSTSGVVTGLTVNGKEIGIIQGQKPRIENINGQNVVGEVKQSLQQLTFPDGLTENFKFAVSPKLLPTLDITGISNLRSFTWDPATKFILQDGIWSYKIIPAEKQFSNAQISRTNLTGQSEYWFDDAQNGQKITQGVDGIKHVEEFFTTGPIKGEPRKIEEIKNGIATVIRSISYDEKGRVIRDIAKDSATTTFTYDDPNLTRTRIIEYKNGIKQTTVWKDGKIVSNTQVINGITSQITNKVKL